MKRMKKRDDLRRPGIFRPRLILTNTPLFAFRFYNASLHRFALNWRLSRVNTLNVIRANGIGNRLKLLAWMKLFFIGFSRFGVKMVIILLWCLHPSTNLRLTNLNFIPLHQKTKNIQTDKKLIKLNKFDFFSLQKKGFDLFMNIELPLEILVYVKLIEIRNNLRHTGFFRVFSWLFYVHESCSLVHPSIHLKVYAICVWASIELVQLGVQISSNIDSLKFPLVWSK